MGDPVVHFEVVGNDGDRLKAFYGDLFGWRFEETPSPMNYGVVEAASNGDGAGIGGGVGGTGCVGGHVTFYVAVQDIEAALERAQELGGRRLRGPDPVPGMDISVAHISDPEGHLIGLVTSAS